MISDKLIHLKSPQEICPLKTRLTRNIQRFRGQNLNSKNLKMDLTLFESASQEISDLSKITLQFATKMQVKQNDPSESDLNST